MSPLDQQVSGNEDWVGSERCQSCHREVYDQFIKTAHFRTSAPASAANVMGSFAKDSNYFIFNEHMFAASEVKVVMEQRDSGLFQVAYINGTERRIQRFDITTGAGRKGQTYLFWRGDQLLQLPMSYFVATHSWANSPGFPADQVKFNRIIPSHCLECHATYARVEPGSDPSIQPGQAGFRAEAFDRSHVIYGVGCERCHGAGAKHVAYHSAHPAEQKGMYITNPSRLGRDLAMDVCADCHSGVRKSLRPPFSFQAGDTLSAFFGTSPAVDTVRSEVHGNQVGLLAASRCYRMSERMTCGTCHDPHRTQEDAVLLSAKCQQCHQPSAAHFCKMASAIGAVIAKKCVDCHMPVSASAAVNLLVHGQDKAVPLSVRTHRIAIYPLETARVMEMIQKEKSNLHQ